MQITKEQREAWETNTAHGAFNRWLYRQVHDDNGSLDLNAMFALAERYGVTARYDHLNPGQQRMNVGNRLRLVVPKSEYE